MNWLEGIFEGMGITVGIMLFLLLIYARRGIEKNEREAFDQEKEDLDSWIWDSLCADSS